MADKGLIVLRMLEVPGRRRGGTEIGRTRFASGGDAQREQYKRNYEYRNNLSAALGQRIEAKVLGGKRGAASTGRLVRVSTDPGNTHVDNTYVGIGKDAFLNKSFAKYWRTFEEGSAAVWKHPFVGTTLFPTGRKVPRPVAHGAHPGLRTSRSGFAPGGKNAEHDGELFVVTHEIAPANIYGQLRRDFHDNAVEFGLQSTRMFLDRVLRQEFLVRGAGPAPTGRIGRHGPQTDQRGFPR